MTAAQILSQANMSTRAAFYAGRGATVSDLTEKHLFAIHGLIKKHHGDKAAESFVQMVAGMKEMSATAFINELYSLEGSKWEFKTVAGHGGMDFDKDANGEYNLAQGMFAMAAALGNRGRDDSPMIRDHFLRCHGVKPKQAISKDGTYIESYY